jgi:hypothetical protein
MPPELTTEQFLVELEKRVLAGITPADPILKEFKGSPEQAAALFAREVMESDHASAEDLSTMRFIG